MAQDFALEADFADRYGPWAVIAGGSEGTGEHFARGVAGAGVNLVLVARREAPLAALADELRAEVNVRTVVADLATPEAVDLIADATSDVEVGLLICNAGATTRFGRFTEWQSSELDHLIAMNCHTTARLAHHFGAPMRSRRRGGLMFVGSMAGFAGSGHQSIYNATKAFMWVLAEGLWHDLGVDEVDVVALVLGATETPAHGRMDADFSSHTTMTAADVAAEGLANIGSGPLHVVGEHNRAVVPYILGRDRAQIVNLMSRSSAAIAGEEHDEVTPRTSNA